MKLISNLKKQVEETRSKEEAKKVIEEAGMQLTDEELEKVAWGISGDDAIAGRFDHVKTVY